MAGPEPSQRRRLICLFGNTWANLHNEILFVRNSLIGFAPGDLLLLNVPLICAPADQPDEVVSMPPVPQAFPLTRQPRPAASALGILL